MDLKIALDSSYKLNFCAHTYPGMLITFCGLDGCGKTTLIEMTNNYLSKKNCSTFLTKQPTDEFRNTPIFRNVQDTPEHLGYDYRAMSLMAAADRIQHCTNTILPALRSGKIVLSDRYFYSCFANLRARGYVYDTWIYEIVQYIPKPDISFFFDIDVSAALQRIRKRPQEVGKFIDIDLQYKLKKEYIKTAQANNCVILETSDSPEITFSLVKKELMRIGL